MEEVKKFNRVLFLVVLIKILGGLLTHSYTMIASSLLELLLIILSITSFCLVFLKQSPLISNDY